MPEGSGLTPRSLGLGIGITLFLASTSAYIALRLGILPWPIIFSVVVSGGVLKVLTKGKTNVHEVNVAQAGGTIGGLLAAAVVFTIPGIIFLQRSGVRVSLPSIVQLIPICIVGGLLGVLLSVPLRQRFIEEERLPYPEGTAGAVVLKAEVEGGRHALFFASVLLLAGAFALTRDMCFPCLSVIGLGIYLILTPSLMGAGAGYILGPRPSGSWLLGAVVGWGLIIPGLVALGWEAPDPWTINAPVELIREMGMGLVLGSGLGSLLCYLTPKVPFGRGGIRRYRWILVASLVSWVVLCLCRVPPLASGIAILGAWVMAPIAARMTGETNIDPLEQFGIVVALLCFGVYSLFHLPIGYHSSILICCFVATATALAGDIGHDYKSAQIIGTRPGDILKVDLVCVIAAGVVVPFVLHTILGGYSDVLFTPAMPAPQATLVARSLFGFRYWPAFLAGLGIALGLEVARRFSAFRNPIALMPFGIGMFLGMEMAIPLAIGGLFRHLVERRYPDKGSGGLMVAAGLLGGEGLAGFALAALIVAGIGKGVASLALVAVFVPLLAIALYMWSRSRGGEDVQSG